MESPQPSRGRQIRRRIRQRRALQLVVCLAALAFAVPALFANAPKGTDVLASASEVPARGAQDRPGVSEQTTATTVRPSTSVASTATAAVPVQVPSTTQAAPPTTVEAVTWHPSTTVAPPVTAPPSTAPVTAAPPATAAPAAARPGNSESGIASYYDDPNGGCAHKTLPFGTVVHITASNGRTASCVVDDRGPFGPGRILDLDTEIFARLAPLSAGLVSVTATW